MTRYEAYISKDWEETGEAYLMAARFRDDGQVEVGVLFLDPWCQGVRDAAFADDYSEAEFRDALRTDLPDEARLPIHPACAKKFLEGAVAYAQQFGFAPPRDYKKVRRMLNGVEVDACPENFTFGRNGKPFFLIREDDEPERIERVLAMLRARCGEDGFLYAYPVEEDDPSSARQKLLRWLEDEPEGVPRFYEVSGLITAMQLCPQPLPPAEILKVLWGPKGRRWENKEAAAAFLELVNNYWNYVADLIMDCVDASGLGGDDPVDIWEEDFENHQGMVDAQCDWAAGFRRAAEIWRQAWGDTLIQPDLASAWAIVGSWADAWNPPKGDASARTTPAGDLKEAVATLARALRGA